MATGAAKGTGQRGSGGRAAGETRTTRAGRKGPWPVSGRVLAVLLVLLALEAVLFVLAGSKGSPSWQAGYTVGLRLGRAAVHSGAGRQPPAVPPSKDCVPTRSQVDTGITTRTVVIAPHQLDIGQFHTGCLAGYQVAISNRVAVRRPGGHHPRKPSAAGGEVSAPSGQR